MFPSTPAVAWTPAHEVERRLRVELLDRRPGDGASEERGLHVCPACLGPFVVPGRVLEVVAVDRVRLELRCMDCGWCEVDSHADDELAALDRELDRGFADLLWALEVVWIGNEEERIGRFAAALAADAILPEDF